MSTPPQTEGNEGVKDLVEMIRKAESIAGQMQNIIVGIINIYDLLWCA